MVKIFIIFLMAIIILGMLVGAAVALQGRNRLKGLDDISEEPKDSDGPEEGDSGDDFYDEDGNHIYYERSLIRKRKYAREHPEEEGELRTFRRLFSRKNN